MTEKPVEKLDSITARCVAEYASSLRSRKYDPSFIVTRFDRDERQWCMKVSRHHSPCSGPDGVVTPLETRFVQPERPPVTEISIRAKGMDHDESLMRYDAVFWSEAAVEKFLFPYYASKYQWLAAHVLATLSRIFYGYVPGGTEEVSARSEEEIPFAIGHIPRSDYVELEEHPAIAHELYVLFRDAEGKVTHRPLADFL
jgi:hypothetical protein